MALTRKSLKAMGLTDEQVDSIIEMHTETVDGLKESLEKAKTDAKALPAVQKELDAAKDALKAAQGDGWKDKYDALKKEFEEHKAQQTAKETKAAKEKAVRAWYEGKGITGKALEIAMRGSSAEIDALELEDGKIKDASALEALVKGDFSGLVGQTVTKGVDVAHPVTTTGGTMTKADIYKKDEKGRYVMSASERQKALMDNKIV